VEAAALVPFDPRFDAAAAAAVRARVQAIASSVCACCPPTEEPHALAGRVAGLVMAALPHAEGAVVDVRAPGDGPGASACLARRAGGDGSAAAVAVAMTGGGGGGGGG
jgi:hypothetical protein